MYVMKLKISDFWKTKFPIIKFPFIDDFTLNIHEIHDFLMFWSLMAFFGLHWPFWSFWPWMNFLSKYQPLVMKIKQKRAVSYNQMSKPNSESKSPIYSTVTLRNLCIMTLDLSCNPFLNCMLQCIFCLLHY